jgi:hypothetical protein
VWHKRSQYQCIDAEDTSAMPSEAEMRRLGFGPAEGLHGAGEEKSGRYAKPSNVASGDKARAATVLDEESSLLRGLIQA